MVRSNLLSKDRFQLYDELPEEEQAPLINGPNGHFDDRMRLNEERGFLVERGIDIRGLDSTTIPDTIGQRAWADFTRTRQPYHPGLVREFYASMIPEVFRALGRVWVRGVPLEITSQAINEYLHAPTDPDEEYPDGFPARAWFNPQLRDMAAILRQDGSDIWVPKTADLHHGDLKPDMAFWSVFLKHSVIPSTHRTLVSVETAQLLYAIRVDVNFDVGHFILNSILKTGCNTQCLLNFPCLITHFCRRAGIAAASVQAELVAPPADVCKKTYNLFCTRQGLPNISSGRRYRNRGSHGAVVQEEEPQVQDADPPQQPRPPRPPRQPRQQAPPPADILAVIQEVRTTQLAHGAILERVADFIATPPPSPPRSEPPPPTTSPRRPSTSSRLLNCFYVRKRWRRGAGTSSSRQP